MAQNKKIAILSGKGGTGKTLVSVNLAALEHCSTYVDCDVEEPNGHLFFKPVISTEKEVCVNIPQIDASLCTGCRECVNFCRFNALAYIGKLMIFDEVCHSCGGCIKVCPVEALTEKKKLIGRLQLGKSADVSVITGIMNIGEASGVPIIRALLRYADLAEGTLFIDCAPGSSCAVMETIRNVDYCVLVAEPTIFGLNNLILVHKLVKLLNKPCGAVINKCEDFFNPSESYCFNNGIKILGKIPYDKELGKLTSDAKIAVNEDLKYCTLFGELLKAVKSEVYI